MKKTLTIIGIIVTLFSWFNPFGLDTLVRIALFIVGFDMMGVIVKILIFWLNFAFPVFGENFSSFTWTLLLMLFSEMILVALGADKPYRFIVKPGIVFVAVFVSLGFQPALILAGIDLLMNMLHKIKRDWKVKKTKKREKSSGKKEKLSSVAEKAKK